MLVFCLFSYNRGKFLENCIASIEKSIEQAVNSGLVSPKIYIFDDDSDDRYTQEVLTKAALRHMIVTPPKGEAMASKFGGLYNNMARAVEMMPAGSLVCFIQDDMQCVRQLTEHDLTDIQLFFDQHPKAAFLHPAFLRGGKRARDKKSMQLNDDGKSYFRINAKQSAGINFSAIVIFKVDKLRENNWTFEFREKINDIKAGEMFGKMGFMVNPFFLWLPNVPVYRGKRKTVALKFAEKIRKSGFYPVKFMTPEQSIHFTSRDFTHLPVAEDFLELDSKSLSMPWIYYALEGKPILKQLNRIELFFSRLFSK